MSAQNRAGGMTGCCLPHGSLAGPCGLASRERGRRARRRTDPRQRAGGLYSESDARKQELFFVTLTLPIPEGQEAALRSRAEAWGMSAEE
jgi:hypothetical protein